MGGERLAPFFFFLKIKLNVTELNTMTQKPVPCCRSFNQKGQEFRLSFLQVAY